MLLTTKEAAALLRVSDWTIRDMVNTGRLPAIKLTKRTWRIDQEHLLQILRGESVVPVQRAEG